jgi:hypothetical protein
MWLKILQITGYEVLRRVQDSILSLRIKEPSGPASTLPAGELVTVKWIGISAESKEPKIRRGNLLRHR